MESATAQHTSLLQVSTNCTACLEAKSKDGQGVQETKGAGERADQRPVVSSGLHRLQDGMGRMLRNCCTRTE